MTARQRDDLMAPQSWQWMAAVPLAWVRQRWMAARAWRWPGNRRLAVVALQVGQKGLDDLGEADHAASLQRRTKDARSCP